MRYLLDTHAFLWWCLDDRQLSEEAKNIIADRRTEIYLSSASVWEIAIKAAKGRLILPEHPAQYVANRMSAYYFLPLPIQISHAAHVYELPDYHADPFDRLLVSQSQLEALPLLTKDDFINKYDVETVW